MRGSTHPTLHNRIVSRNMWSRLLGISDGPNCPCAFSRPANRTGRTSIEAATSCPRIFGTRCHEMYAYGLRKSRYMASVGFAAIDWKYKAQGWMMSSPYCLSVCSTSRNSQQTTDNRQQTTDNRQQTTDNRQQTTKTDTRTCRQLSPNRAGPFL